MVTARLWMSGLVSKAEELLRHFRAYGSGMGTLNVVCGFCDWEGQVLVYGSAGHHGWSCPDCGIEVDSACDPAIGAELDFRSRTPRCRRR